MWGNHLVVQDDKKSCNPQGYQDTMICEVLTWILKEPSERRNNRAISTSRRQRTQDGTLKTMGETGHQKELSRKFKTKDAYEC